MIDLSNIKVGDKLAMREKGSGWGRYSISHRILVVERVTATQVVCLNENGGGREIRFRKSDGREIGESYSYAEPATEELLSSINEQRSRLARHLAASRELSDLEGKHLHQLNLTLGQTEALAKAWLEVKAMGAKL